MSVDPVDLWAAARVHDLSFVVRDHFRWRHDRETVQSLAAGDPFETTRFTMSAHGFTHADAPAHVVAGAATLDQLPAEHWVGPAVVLDLTDRAADDPIGPAELDRYGDAVRPGDIVLLCTGWDRRMPVESPDYWARAPYVTPDGARWLAASGARCVGFDFPQDRAIRRGLHGDPGTPAEFVTHDVLLRHGIGLLEYLCGLYRIQAARVFLVAAPVKLADSDGGPVRALAFEP